MKLTLQLAWENGEQILNMAMHMIPSPLDWEKVRDRT
jgi:hypothetical protein